MTHDDDKGATLDEPGAGSSEVGQPEGSAPGAEPNGGELQAYPDPQAGRGEDLLESGGDVHPSGDEGGSAYSAASLTYTHIGPLPPPGDFMGYEQVLSGAADRILTMAEKTHAAEIENQRITTRAEARAFLGAAWAVAFFPWLLGIATIGLLIAGEPASAALTGLATAFSIGPQIIAETRSKKQSK